MPNLKQAYDNCVGVLKPQRQGTCGLYSFWFATLLVNNINTEKKPIVYPRKHEERAATGVAKGSETQQSRPGLTFGTGTAGAGTRVPATPGSLLRAIVTL